MRRPKVPISSVLLLVPALLLAACGDDDSGGGNAGGDGDEGGGETVTLTVDEPEADVAVGDTVEIELEENASVGDDWRVTSEPSEEVLELTDDTFESEGGDDCDGCGGTRVLTYEVVGEGATTIELHNCYRCDSEGNSTEEPPEPADLAFSVSAR